jgi:CRISPR-associated endonuclease/helicase Cas3
MRDLLSLIKNKNLDDPQIKESHLGKTLAQHIEESWSSSEKLLEVLELDENCWELCMMLCLTHDLGKLDKRWNLKSPKVKHASRSLELLEKHSEILKILRMDVIPILKFAVLKHHSSLSVINLDKIHRDLRNNLVFLQNLNPDYRIRLADAIGVFKLSDILSAMNLDNEELKRILSQYDRNLSIFNKNVVARIREGAERTRKTLDRERFSIQYDIASLRAEHVGLIAPTGWGKTAVAILRFLRCRPRKMFYCLPTITAIKEFRDDMKGLLGEDYVGDYFFFSDVDFFKGEQEHEQSYILDLYRYFVPKVIITTIDQLLITLLQIGRYHLRRFNLRGSLVVIDEFHLITPQMFGMLKASLEIHSSYSIKLLLMSASPLKTYLTELKEALGNDLEILELRDEYRKLRRHSISLKPGSLEELFVNNMDVLRNKKSRILVLANKPERAAYLYRIIKDELRARDITLIHARFTYGDRDRKEREIDTSRIVVSTQVAEVSLDKSFDVLLTEIAPLPSLIQRLGRVNRYGVGHSHEKFNVYIALSSDYSPYTKLEVDFTKDLLNENLSQINERDESIFITLLKRYECLIENHLRKEIRESCQRAKRAIENDCRHFYSLVVKEDKLQTFFGRDVTYLAIPEEYEEEVHRLAKDLKETDNYTERRGFLASIKNYFVPTPPYVRMRLDPDLNLYVISDRKYRYNPELGLIGVSQLKSI